jgi:hypothetical protein
MGFRAGAPVNGFSAMVSSRDELGQSRGYVVDAGAQAMTPDLVLERSGLNVLKIRNRSAAPFGFRLNVAGRDLNAGHFEYAYEFYTQPPNSTLVLRFPENPSVRTMSRELDTNNDGTPDVMENAPANGQLRIGPDAGLLALRWREAGRGETLECTSNLTANSWSPVSAPLTMENGERVARVSASGPAQFYRVKPMTSNCLSLSTFALGARPNPWETNGFRFEALSAVGAMLPQNTIAIRSGFTGLDVLHTVRVQPLDDCQVVHVDVFQTSGSVTFEAVGVLGAVVARQTLTGPGAGPQRVTLRGLHGRIHFVRVISPNGLCLILNVCCERARLPQQTASNCLSLSNAPAGQFPSPYSVGDVAIAANPGPVIVGPVSGLSGNWLKVSGQIEFKLLNGQSCEQMTFQLRDLEGVVTATAYNGSGAIVGTAGPATADGTPQEFSVDGAGMTRVVLSSTSDKAFVQTICWRRIVVP